MNKSVWRLALVIGLVVALAGCGNKETKEALQKTSDFEAQKKYVDANRVLMDALKARETQLRGDTPAPTEQADVDALRKKVKSDGEFLKLEREQVRLYLYFERADMASTVYADIQSGNPGDSVVFELLKDKDPLIRAGAVRILGLIGKAENIDTVASMMKDPNDDVRRATVTALAAIKDPKTVPLLVQMTKDSYWFARSDAASALGQKHDAAAVKPLLDAVLDSDKSVQSSAENALVWLSKDLISQGKNATATAAGDDLNSRLNDASPKVVLVAAVCLALLKDSRCIPALQKLIDSPDAIARLDAVKGLGETGDPAVIPTLRVTLKSTDMNMRGWSIIGLGNLKDQGSLADLQAIAADNAQPQAIRDAANGAIKKITGQTSALTEP